MRSTTLKNLKLHYDHNRVFASTAVIFVTTEVEGREGLIPLVYKNAVGCGKVYESVFKEFLQFDNVETCVNYNKN